MPPEPKSWGKILLGVRLEKMVEAGFFHSWSLILTQGLRPGDRFEFTEGMIATAASNALVEMLLKSDCDSLLIIDSDGDFEPDFVGKMRDHEPGWVYDGLQAFYTRRGWPPQAIWFKRDGNGILHSCILLGETTEDVALIGTHCALIRREVFEKLLGKDKPEEHDWFWYPRHQKMTEDAAFSEEALAAGFRLGATTAVKTNHIGHLPVGWDAYQEYLHTSGQVEQLNRFDELLDLMQKFTGLSVDEITARMLRGNDNVLSAWNLEKPEGAEAVRGFYGEDHYLFDLLNWNCSTFYVQITRPLADYHGKQALVLGAGLGSEAALLAENNSVDVFELPGTLRDFCKSRLDGSVHYLEGNTIPDAVRKQYDLVVAIDTIEHFHPDEFDQIMASIGAAIVPGGVLYCHNNFSQQDLYPMHFQHAEAFSAWAQANHLRQTSDFTWVKQGDKP